MLIVLAIVLVCGTVATALGAAHFVFVTKVDNQAKAILSGLQHTPGVYVTLTVKRASMRLNGVSTAEAYIFPRGGPNFDGALSFDAVLTHRNEDVVTTYTLVNTRALTTSTVLDEVQGTAQLLCDNGKLLQLSFAGENYVFCTAQDSKLQRAASDDLNVVIQYVSDPTLLPDLVTPWNGTATPLDCPVVVSSGIPPTPVAPTYMETASMVYNAATGPKRSFMMGKLSCECRRAKQPCLFVHGLGNSKAGPMVDTFKSYWGKIHEHSPCCSSTKFVQFDTVTQGWTDPNLQREFCTAALEISQGASQSTVGSLILVTHSMGNLLAGGAVASGMCQFSSRVTWMSLAGPMQGSQSTNLVASRCAASNSWFDRAFADVLGLTGLCPSPRAYVQLQHQSTVGADMQAKYQQAQAVRRTHGARVLCGTDPFGIGSPMSIALASVGAISGHADRAHDGVVDLTSCMAGVSTSGAGSDSSDYHYRAAINHLDTSFRHGDGWWGNDRKPQKWFECAL
ncbi:hypothetical protein DYB34_000588 [Aphanomyces astaci]|uniref:GPI inositol-deacylase n=1 Tax=Aphanomyces astaci TaxID=112090 RepID=A0A3R6X5P9_APHAT|nr:hypothetical protein DYB34_000588 [Aphanomyces astaci]